MNKNDWKNTFPKPTESFHNKLCFTLDNLEKERIKMKKLQVKKSILIAAAAALLIGTVSFASTGVVRTITGSSSSKPDYNSVPAEEQLVKKMGVSPKILEKFSNGYEFADGNDSRNAVKEEGNKKIADFNSIMCRYKNNEDEILLSADAEPEAHDEEMNPVTQTYCGVDIRYNSYTGKYVPEDYELTEQDKIDEANGDVVFSYGTDEVMIMQIQGVSWEQDGIYYGITAMDSPLGEQDLIDMSKEIIDF